MKQKHQNCYIQLYNRNSRVRLSVHKSLSQRQRTVVNDSFSLSLSHYTFAHQIALNEARPRVSRSLEIIVYCNEICADKN